MSYLTRISGLSSLNQYRLPERGARIARREERAYRRYVSDEQRREAGRPARQAVVIQRGQAARSPLDASDRGRSSNRIEDPASGTVNGARGKE